jgi:NAD(P)-dependent dehydrogenase (short-subunit alcohol dehydrogenase family)
MHRENSMLGNGLQDKRVVVLGGSSGIGLEVAKQASSHGASVVIASSSAERVQKAVESVGAEAQGQAVDVSDERAVATFFSKLDVFDHLVFTAGDSLHLHDLAATDLQQARHAFELRYFDAGRIQHGADGGGGWGNSPGLGAGVAQAFDFRCHHQHSGRPVPSRFSARA